MNFWETLRIAFRALRTNILRSFLTILGIIVGVASVVSMVAFAFGAQIEISRQIRTLGANVLIINPSDTQTSDDASSQGSRSRLSERDAPTIVQRVRSVVAGAPSIYGDARAVRKTINHWTTINGTTSEYFVVREWPLSSGRYFSNGEQIGAGKVAIVGRTTADRFFPDQDPIGGTIRVLAVPLTVIGVLEEKGTSGTGSGQDDIIFVPISTIKRRIIGSANAVHRDSVDYLMVKVASSEQIDEAKEEIAAVLRAEHRLRPGRPDDFEILEPATAMHAENAAKRTIGWLLAAIASVSLVVGGISIMNIMLVSVTERTREIGLRRAIGARISDVQRQFLMESVVLCVLGGIVGLGIGAATAIVVGRVAGWPVYFSPLSIIGAIGLAGFVGVIFGYFPARRAARLDPIVALRTD